MVEYFRVVLHGPSLEGKLTFTTVWKLSRVLTDNNQVFNVKLIRALLTLLVVDIVQLIHRF
jgi:hypothetical protein